VAEILVLGGGVCGLGTALMLARDGHEVTVLERDPQPPPASAGEAWQAWERRGVVQFHQPHFVQARGRHVLDTELPDVRDALLAVPLLRQRPSAVEGAQRKVDRELLLGGELDERLRDLSRPIGFAEQDVEGARAELGVCQVKRLLQALREGEEALALAREIGWRSGEAYALGELAACLAAFHANADLLEVIVVYLGGVMSVNVWFMKGFFDTIPVELDESARVDGATPAQIFWGVVLPLGAPVLAVVGLLSFIFTINEFILASALLQTPQHFTLPVGMRGFIDQQYDQHWGPFAAGVLIAAVPAALLFIFLQRYIVQGLTAGSVKG